MMTNSARWPDTTQLDKPEVDNPWHEARWLVGRHLQLQRLVQRVPGVATRDEDGWWVDLEVLKELIAHRDAYVRAWEEYRQSHAKPHWRNGEPDAAYQARADAWEAAGPKAEDYEPEGTDNDGRKLVHHGAIEAYGVMSRTEQVRLRLLATVGNGRVLFAINDLWGFDDEGRQLIRDWCSLVLAR